MKRCPQCEFIYEDDQSLCDMDGVLLVFDSRALPNTHALATVSGPMPDKVQRRNRVVPAFATLILMMLIASVYYVTAVRTTADKLAPANIPTVQTEAAATIPEATPQPAAAEAVEAPTPEPAVERAVNTDKADTKAGTHPTTAPKPAATPAKKAATQPVPVRSPEPKKDESKVGSILKKTGKILKKPFKF